MEIVKKLNLIKGEKDSIDAILKNYYMGLITIMEMYKQIGDTLLFVEKTKKEIKEEYKINDIAIELMLMM